MNPNPPQPDSPSQPPLISPPLSSGTSVANPPSQPPVATPLPPVKGVLEAIEAVLRQPWRIVAQMQQAGSGKLVAAFLLIALASGAVYGFVMGAFSGGMQYWAGPLKVCLGLLFSTLICLPSLYILACLGGSRARLREVIGLVSGMLALLTVLLIGFAPVAWVFSQSTNSVVVMGFLHLLFGAVSALFAFRFLNAGITQLSGKSVDSLILWLGLFLLVMLQMTTALRPLVGKADTLLPTEKKFFISHWFDCLDNSAADSKKETDGERRRSRGD